MEIADHRLRSSNRLMTQNATLPSRAISGAFLPAMCLAKIRRPDLPPMVRAN
jgi:hypothetical protein